MTKISGSNRPIAQNGEGIQLASEIKSLNQAEKPSSTPAVEKSSHQLSAKEVQSRIGELKMAGQIRESELRSQPLDLKRTDGIASTQIASLTGKMQEMNMSFNLQYQNLQQKMQDEIRKLTLLTNVLETKYNTAKNSIGKVR